MSSQETRATKTKGIATLFLSSSVLVGFMAMGGLSFPQSVSAAKPSDFPQCPGFTEDFSGGNCVGPAPTSERGCANPDQKITGPADKPEKQKCTGGGAPPADVITIEKCIAGFTLTDGRCLAKPGKRTGQQD